MTKETSVGDQRLLHSVYKIGESGKTFGVLKPAARAEAVAGDFVQILEGEDRVNDAASLVHEFRGELATLKIPGKIGSYQELKDFAWSPKGSKESKQLAYDIRLGAVMALQRMADVDSDEAAAMRTDIVRINQLKNKKKLGSDGIVELNGLVSGLQGQLGGRFAEGLVMDSVGYVITNKELKKVLNLLERKQSETGQFKKSDVDTIQRKLDEWYLDDVVPQEQIAMVQEYLSWAIVDSESVGVINNLGTKGSEVVGGGMSGVRGISQEDLIKAVQEAAGRSKAGGGVVDPKMFTMGNEGVSGAYQVAREIEGYRLNSADYNEVYQWVSNLSESLASNPLYWAGGWQQVAPYVISELDRVCRSAGIKDEKYDQLRALVSGRIAFETSRSAIMASDESLDTFMKLMPPVENMPDEFILNQASREAMEFDPLTSEVLGWMVDDAYNTEKDGRSVRNLLNTLKSERSLNEYIDSMVGNIIKSKATMNSINKSYSAWAKKTGFANIEMDNEKIKSRVKTAVTVFLVDEYPQWAEWLHQGVDRGNGRVQESRFSWYSEPSTIKRRNMPDDTTYVDVPSFQSYKFGEYETFVKHPFVALWENSGLLRAKGGSYGEYVLTEYERGMNYLAAKRFTKKGQRGGVRLAKPSEIDGKNINRYGKATMAIIKDFYGSGFEGNWPDLETAIQQMMNMGGVDEKWKYEDVGYIVSHVMVAKLRAARAADPRTYLEAVINVVGMAADSLAEEDKMLSEFFGSGKNAMYGPLRDAVAQYGLKIGTPELKAEIDSFVTGIKGPKAGFWRDVLGAIGTGTAIVTTVQDIMSGGKASGSKKRR